MSESFHPTGKRPANTPELKAASNKTNYSGIPTTEAEEKAKKMKNEWLPVQLQSEAFD